MKKRKAAITKLVFIGIAVIIGLVLSLVPIQLGLTDYKSFIGSIQLGIDLKGGVYAVYEVDEEEDTTNLAARLEGTRERILSLLESKGGYTEATIVTEGDNRLRVEVPDVEDPSQIFEIIGEPADMQFVYEGSIVITGDNVTNAVSQYDSSTGNYAVRLELNSAGASSFYEATSKAAEANGAISIIINGETLTSPTVNDPISNGVALITGSFTKEQADTLAGQILAGAMGVKLNLIESSTVSATLGQEALTLGLIAGGVALILIMAFMALVYRMFGGIADIALLIYTILMFFFLATLPWVQLTLPGMAGIILSLGMAVDANVIIFERIKDGYRQGKSISSSVHAGFKNARSSIIDANVTTLIAAIVLWILGSGPVKGFAITLFIGIILSLFTSLIVTRGLVKIFLNLNKENAKLYNLKRDAGVEEIPDEDEFERPKRVRKGTRLKRGGEMIDA